MTGVEDKLGALLLDLAIEPSPLGSVDTGVYDLWPGAQLGGDPLRPYAVRQAGGRVELLSVRRAGLPDPPLVAELLSGRYSVMSGGREAERSGTRWTAQAWRLSVPISADLATRMDIPDLLLVGLGDRDRYRGARLPLGVARLASWLRFTHAARVDVVDYSLSGDPLAEIAESCAQRHPQVVGVGVNFGQWRMLADLAELLEQATASRPQSPVVVLGNILAAFSPAESAEPFKRASQEGRILVAAGLGERPLEALCRTLDKPDTWSSIPGLINPCSPAESRPTQPEPPSMVAPDDGLVLAVAGEGGQIALETSFGCQYGACTFCPRSHKGDGWSRGEDEVCAAILERIARLPGPPAVSLVDEEFFGTEGLADPPPPKLAAARILTVCRDVGLRYEVYTRLEQLFDRRRSQHWNLRRATLLATAAPYMRRLFVGVESGSPGQLRRYGKGQTVAQTVDALRVASTLGVPLEFGFITFDPLLTAQELGENLAFLARTDIMCAPHGGDVVDSVAQVGHYLNGTGLTASGVPVYQHVAYMATELEVLANSRYADHLQRRHPALLDGYDPSYARYTARYADPAIEDLAGWCRVWTEGMFAPIYAARMKARSSEPGGTAGARELVARYRDATFALLVALAARLVPSAPVPTAPPVGDPVELLTALAADVLPDGPADFDLGLRERRRVE